MRGKFFLALIWTILFTSLITSCGKEANLSLKEIGQDIILYKQNGTVYSHETIINLQKQKTDILSFCEENGIDCYKTINAVKYVVMNTTEGLYVVFFATNDIQPTIQQVIFSPLSCKENIEGLCVGMPIGDVRTADPNGQYPFSFHSWSGYPKFSYHFFEDGDCYLIMYSSDVVSEIIHFTI